MPEAQWQARSPKVSVVTTMDSRGNVAIRSLTCRDLTEGLLQGGENLLQGGRTFSRQVRDCDSMDPGDGRFWGTSLKIRCYKVGVGSGVSETVSEVCRRDKGRWVAKNLLAEKPGAASRGAADGLPTMQKPSDVPL